MSAHDSDLRSHIKADRASLGCAALRQLWEIAAMPQGYVDTLLSTVHRAGASLTSHYRLHNEVTTANTVPLFVALVEAWSRRSGV